MNIEKTFAILKLVGAFVGKQDVRKFLHYIHVSIEDNSTLIFSSDGHIAIAVRINEILNDLAGSINPNLKYGIQKVDDLDRDSIDRIKLVFDAAHKEGSSANFNVSQLNTVTSSINTFAKFCKIKFPKVTVSLGGEKEVAEIKTILDEVNIKALIMPVRQ
jgi:hypothetical protein